MPSNALSTQTVPQLPPSYAYGYLVKTDHVTVIASKFLFNFTLIFYFFNFKHIIQVLIITAIIGILDPDASTCSGAGDEMPLPVKRFLVSSRATGSPLCVCINPKSGANQV